MFVIIGIVVVIGSVLGGFVMHHGQLEVLVQVNEFIIIGGAAIGSMLVSAPMRIIKHLVSNIGTLFKGDPYTKEQYLNLLRTMFQLFHIATKDGLMNIEQHIEKPESSAIFTKNAFLLHHHHALPYLTDTLKLLLSGGVPAHDLEALLDADMETLHAESSQAPGLLSKVSDSLPGLGIVAAVLGIIITMQAINGPPEEIGMKVAAALVGTFLGILLCYGFLGPMAAHIETIHQSEARYMECIKVGVISYAKGNAPAMVVEFSRRVIFSDFRPTFAELEAVIKEAKSAGA
ncbi:MAG: flagellar motor stator protein MotA [Bacteroidetes bacterium]|nr:MAG: flagellar motor stator protein MotA [Bacteroidota bacterium]